MEAAIGEAARRAVLATDAAFLLTAAAEGLPDGTTAVFALHLGRRYLIGNLGDSVAVLCGTQPGTRLYPEDPGVRLCNEEPGGCLHPEDGGAHPHPGPQPTPESLQRGGDYGTADSSTRMATCSGAACVPAAERAAARRLQSASARGGAAQLRSVQLTRDHSLEREDEAARILGAGGSISATAGAA